MNNLDLLRPAAVFATVVEEGSFRAAADRLGLSAPYVSQLVADLERRLGRQLLYRSTRKLALSADGERFLPLARQISDASNSGFSAFRSDTDALAGRLRLSVPTVLAAPFFAGLIAEFQAKHPKLELTIFMDDEPSDPMDRQTDLAIRIGDPGDDARPARKLFDTHGVICTSSDMARAIHVPEDLRAHRWIKTPAMQRSLILTKAGRADPVRIAPETIFTTNNGQLARQLVERNAGWALFPEFTVRDALSSGQIARALPHWFVPNVGVYFLYSARQSSLSNARGLVEFIMARLR